MENRKVLESDLEAGQVWGDFGRSPDRAIVMVDKNSIVYSQDESLQGVLSRIYFVTHYAKKLIAGPEPKSWAEKPKDVYCELVWDGGGPVTFKFGVNGYFCSHNSPGDIIADGYRLLGYCEVGKEQIELAPYIKYNFLKPTRMKYAVLVKDEVTS